MANQTVTTVVNYDSAAISGLLDGETITINGGSVTVNADVRWNQQAAVFGAVTLSASLGGSFLLDGTQIWEVPFSASSGNVPAQLALGSNGVTGGTSGATGELTRVWAAGSLTPATAGGAMPASGFIKLRSKTGDFVSGEVITLPGGATVTASGAGKRSWIHVVGRGTTTGAGSLLTIPRLGVFDVSGDWYELGTTNGADNQTFQYPVADQCPAIWIETAPASGVYEVWLNAGARWSNGAVALTDRRGMYFGCVTATGVITLALRGGSNAGLKPPSGCRVRIPNVIMSQANGTLPDYNSNILPASLTSRYSFVTSGAGSIAMDKASCNWYIITSAAFAIDITNCGIGGSVSFSNTGTTINMNNVGIGIVDAVAQNPLAIATSFGGGALTDVFCGRGVSGAAGVSVVLTDTADFTLTRCRSDVFGAATTNLPAATQSCFETARAINTTMTDCVAIGGIGVDAQPAFGLTITGFKYASRTIGTTQTTETAAAISAGVGSTDLFVDGFANYDNVTNVHPYNNIIIVASGMNAVEVRNIGTPAAPYNMGSANACANVINASVTRSVTVRRVYTLNTRTAPFAVANTVQGFDVYNFWGDAPDAQANAAINATMRGGRYTPSVTGQVSVYGTHWQDAWTSTTAGQLVIACNEPTADTADQCSFTLNAAVGSGFTSAGNVSMKSLTDEVIWEMPYYALGVTGFAATAPTITGTNAANHTLTFQHDLTGTGFNGTWLTLNAANLSALTVNPAIGVKLKVRAQVNTANTGNLLTYIRIDTVTNSVAQQTEYPLPVVLNTAQVTNIVAGSRIRVYNVTTATEIVNEIVPGTSWTLLYVEGDGFTSGDVLNIRLTQCDGATAHLGFQGTAIAGATGWSLFASQTFDTVYATNAIDGTTVSEFVLDYPNVQVDIDDPDGESSITRLYAWFANELTTENGIRNLVGGLLAEDAANYKIITSALNLKLDNIATTGVQFIGDLRLYRDDGGAPVVSSTTGGGSITLYAGKVYTISGGGGGGGATAADIWTYSSRTLTANPGPTAAANASAVRTELATELARVDAAISTRLATAGYTAPDNASIAAILVDTDTTIPAQIAARPSAAAIASATRTELAVELARINATISSRSTFNPATDTVARVTLVDTTTTNTDMRGTDNAMLAASYVAPDNAGIAANGLAIAALNDLSAAQVNAQVDLALADYDAPTKAELDSAVSTLVAEHNATQSAIAALPAPLNAAGVRSAVGLASANLDTQLGAIPDASENASAVRSELAVELARIDVDVSSVGGGTSITAADVWSYATRTVTGGTIDTNLDMRGTDNALLAASYVDPDNASIAAILVDTAELQANQGNWLTATGFATPTNVSNAQTAIISEISANEVKIDALAADVAAIPTVAPLDAMQTQSAVAAAITAAEPISANITEVAGVAITGVADFRADVSSLATQASVDALNDVSAADVRAQVDASLADYDAATKADLDAAQASIEANQEVINNGVKKASLLVPHADNL